MVVAMPAVALAQAPFAVLSYNVRGIPAPAIEDRTAEITAIAPLLEDFHTPAPPYVGIPSFVGLQEVFDEDYYKILFAQETISYPVTTDKDSGGAAGIGDGLNLMSDFPISGFTRVQWNDCFGTMGAAGSDCDTNKGFTFAAVTIAEGATIHVYTLHADAGQDEGSREARRKNIEQLAAYINQNSPEGTAVIVLGDTNSKYTRVGNDNLQSLLFGAGLSDAWVQLRRGGIVPPAGPDINADCESADPGTANCELVDKVLYRDGGQLVLAPQSYATLKQMFSDGEGKDLSDHFPVAVTFDWAVVTTTTTSTSSTSSTSTSSTSTSTTIEGERPCGDPVALVATRKARREAAADQRAVAASDALFVLRAAVGQIDCPLCVCDVNSTGTVTASDALAVLKKAVGQDQVLVCPPCT